MPINVAPGEFPNVIEIWGVGPNAIEVATQHHQRWIRITARRVIRGPGGGPYYAHYEEKTAAGVWGVNPLQTFPWQDGPTTEHCLRAALAWVNERA